MGNVGRLESSHSLIFTRVPGTYRTKDRHRPLKNSRRSSAKGRRKRREQELLVLGWKVNVHVREGPGDKMELIKSQTAYKWKDWGRTQTWWSEPSQLSQAWNICILRDLAKVCRSPVKRTKFVGCEEGGRGFQVKLIFFVFLGFCELLRCPLKKLSVACLFD